LSAETPSSAKAMELAATTARHATESALNGVVRIFIFLFGFLFDATIGSASLAHRLDY